MKQPTRHPEQTHEASHPLTIITRYPEPTRRHPELDSGSQPISSRLRRQ